MPRPRGPSHPEITRRNILDAAARIIAADGYHASSLARIAGEAGITAPSLLYYFPTKQALFDEVLRVAWTGLADELRPVLAEDIDAESMFVRVVATLAVAEAGDALLSAITAALLAGPDLGTRAINDTLLPLIDELDDRLRTAARGRIHPQAPLRETLTYIALAHASQHPFGHVAPDAARAIASQEPFIALALFRAVESWVPGSPPTGLAQASATTS